nr:seminal plasma protein A3-like [Pogona vitticeps]
MAFKKIFLWCISVLLPLLATAEGLSTNSHGPCVFPFIYNGKSYSSCTTAGTVGGKLWCSLTSNYDVDPRWTYCDPSVFQV